MSYPYQGGFPQGPGYPPGTGMPQPAPPPAGLPYAAQPYPNTGGYPPGGTFPSQSGFQPPGGMPMPDQASSYPSYPPSSQGVPYPSGGAAPYPTGGAAPYPTGGAAPYPTGGAAPYPTGGGAPYPPSGQGAPYPSGGAASYPTGGGAPYPTEGAAPYPTGGGAPYPTGGAAPYSAEGGTPYPTSGGSPYPGGGSSAAQPTSCAPPRPTAAPSRPPQPASSPAHSSSTTPTQTSQPAHSTDVNLSHYYECAKKPGDTGSVKPLLSGFNAEVDATQIKNCLKSVSVNETVIVNILPHRSNAQRQKIRLVYKTMYGKDLLHDLRERLSGDFESVVAALIMTPAEYDAYLIHRAVEGAGTDEDVLVEILCTRTNAQMKELNSKYKEVYKASIEQHMKGDTGGHFMRMLVSLSNGARLEDHGVNSQKAEEDAKKLYKAGAGRLGTDESTFNSIFVSQSFEQLRAVFTAYQRLYKKDMEKVIKSEMSGDLEKGMKAIVRFTLDKHSYFANALYKAMKGLGTDEKALIRTLVSRSEIDLEQIIRSFSQIKGESKPLNHWIKKETSGPFKDMLLHIIGGGK